ncbi:MAG: AbrB/MazE/SpoVT family DNA-binding domain-containing protein [Acidobacteria bacterium]|nr:AbrB/MazE/SpoVT family DNA-binding domain-containing protein [Acidobacteriota bacterium]
MKFRSKVGERGQVVIPKAIRDNLGLNTDSAIVFELKGTTLTLTPNREMRRFDEALRKYKGSLRKDLLAEGYSSVDDYIRETRGR